MNAEIDRIKNYKQVIKHSAAIYYRILSKILSQKIEINDAICLVTGNFQEQIYFNRFY